MATESGKVVLNIDAKTGQAIAQLAKVSSQMNKVKKTTKDTGAEAKKTSQTFEESFKSFGGVLGFGGAAGVATTAGAGAALGVTAIEGLKKAFEFGMQKWGEYLQSINELNKLQLQRMEQSATTVKDRGLPQGWLAKITESMTKLQPDEATELADAFTKTVGIRETKPEHFQAMNKVAGRLTGTLNKDLGMIYGLLIESGMAPEQAMTTAIGLSRAAGGNLGNFKAADFRNLSQASQLPMADVLNRSAMAAVTQGDLSLKQLYTGIRPGGEFGDTRQAMDFVQDYSKLSPSERSMITQRNVDLRMSQQQAPFIPIAKRMAMGMLQSGKISNYEFDRVTKELESGGIRDMRDAMQLVYNEANIDVPESALINEAGQFTRLGRATIKHGYRDVVAQGGDGQSYLADVISQTRRENISATDARRISETLMSNPELLRQITREVAEPVPQGGGFQQRRAIDQELAQLLNRLTNIMENLEQKRTRPASAAGE